MASFDINNFVKAVLTNASNLAATLFKSYAGQAETDASTFVQTAKAGIARAVSLYQQGKIDKDELEDLIQGKKDLAVMHALKDAGLASAAIDTFVNGLIQIMIDAVFAALKI